MTVGATDYPVIPVDEALVTQMMRATNTLQLPNHPSNAHDLYTYRIGPGDMLLVRMWGKKDLSVSNSSGAGNEQAGQIVSGEGEIYYPYLGAFKVAGKSLEEARGQIVSGLAKYFKDPMVDLTVLEYRSQKVTVTGEVAKPGPLVLTSEPLNVSLAVSTAGGATDAADLANTTVKRADGTVIPVNLLAFYHRGEASQNIMLRPGDTLHVPDNHRNIVFVMGEVLRPLMQRIKGGRLTLAEAINAAAGPNMVTANMGQVYVVRGAVDDKLVHTALRSQKPAAPEGAPPSPITIYHVNAKSPVGIVLADSFPLQPRDVVFISTSPISQWSRIISQLIPTNAISAVDSRRLD